MKKEMKLTTILVMAVSMTLITSCGGKKQQQSPTSAPIAYKTVKVKAEDRIIDTKYSATIRGRQDIQVLPQVSGQLRQH